MGEIYKKQISSWLVSSVGPPSSQRKSRGKIVISIRKLKAVSPKWRVRLRALDQLCPRTRPSPALVIQHDLTIGFQVLGQPPSVVDNDPKGSVQPVLQLGTCAKHLSLCKKLERIEPRIESFLIGTGSLERNSVVVNILSVGRSY